MFWITKKKFNKFLDSLKRKDKDLIKEFGSLKVQISNLDLDNKLSKLEARLSNRIDVVLVEALRNKSIISSPIKSRSKGSLRQVQENRVIHAFRQTKKQIAKGRIQQMLKNVPVPSIKTKLMQELGISKASFYNYLKELDNEIKVQIVQKSK